MGGGSSSSSSSNDSTVKTDNSNLQQNENALALNLDELSVSEVGDNSNVDVALNITDAGAVQNAFEFGSDALDQAFDFGNQSINQSYAFGEEVVREAQDTTRNAINVAGAAQTNAFAKIKEIANSFTSSGDSNTKTILLAIGGAVTVIGMVLFFNRKN